MSYVTVNYKYKQRGGNSVASTTISFSIDSISESALIRKIESMRPSHQVIEIISINWYEKIIHLSEYNFYGTENTDTGVSVETGDLCELWVLGLWKIFCFPATPTGMISVSLKSNRCNIGV